MALEVSAKRKKLVVIAKNRAWLHAVGLPLHVETEAKLVVCLRT